MLTQEYNEKHAAYMNREITHHEFYLWVASQCKIVWGKSQSQYMGRTVEEWARLYQSDQWLNNVSLNEFDALYPSFSIAANRAGVWNALADCTCAHKAVIRARVLEYLKENEGTK